MMLPEPEERLEKQEEEASKQRVHVLDADGKEVYAEGEQPTYAEVETMDFFVEGVVGKIG